VANLPQLILTACYFVFSSLYSTLFQAQEWAEFAKKSQRLKVTVPDEDQESTDFLQIPFAWGAVFVGISATLHWLVSQSLFVAASEGTTHLCYAYYKLSADHAALVLPAYSGDTIAESLQFKVGFSTQALLATLILACVALAIPMGLALRSVPQYSIVVGTNSAAISAQCHPYGRVRPENYQQSQFFDNDMAARPWHQRLKWGVLSPGGTNADDSGHMGLGIARDVIEEPADRHYYD
jgi:hypothetical protein